MKRSALSANRIAALVLAVAMALSLAVGAGTFDASAYEEKTGVIATNSDPLTIRSGPGTSYTTLGKLAKGTLVTIVDEANAADGALWYKIVYEDGYGYAHSNYVRLVEVSDGDTDFEAAIAGFPESYKDDLRAIHALYPNWEFRPVYTNTEWADALEAECALGLNLVSGSSISSWKSTQPGAYDWTTGTWKNDFDSGDWVQASEALIAYYLDPRNYLDANYIFTFLDFAYDDSQTAEGLALVVSGTFMAGTYTENGEERSYVDDIMEAGRQNGMNPYVIATIIRNEVGVNGSDSISGTVPGYEGYYNFYNIGAYAANGMTAIQRGLWYAKGGNGSTSYGRPWDSRYKAILGGAEFYVKNYVSVGQNTAYFKKFNVAGDNLYAHQYMTNVQGAASEGKTLAKAYDDTARGEKLIFRIPVFEHMPETACARPTGDGSPNNKLSALSVDGFALTPGFNPDTLNYDLVVDENTSRITISAAAMDATAAVSGTGSFTLQPGLNVFEVTVTAQNGQTRTYEIDVDSALEPTEPADPPVDPVDPPVDPVDPPVDPVDPPEPPVVDPDPVLSTSLKVDDQAMTVSGLTAVPMSGSELTGALAVTNGSVRVVDAAGSAITGNVGTGCRVQVLKSDGSIWKEYTVIVYGDVNGDGRFTSLDALRIQKHMVGMITLEGAARIAADANRDGKLSSVDALRIQKTVLNLATINQ